MMSFVSGYHDALSGNQIDWSWWVDAPASYSCAWKSSWSSDHVPYCCISSISIFFNLRSPHVSLIFSSHAAMSYNWASTNTSPALLLWLGLLASLFASSGTSQASSAHLVVAHLLTSPSTILPASAVVELPHNFYPTVARSCSSARNLSHALIPFDEYQFASRLLGSESREQHFQKLPIRKQTKSDFLI